MEKINGLFKYIDYFKDVALFCAAELPNNSDQNSMLSEEKVYQRLVDSFVQDVYASGIVKEHYIGMFKQNREKDIPNFIESTNLEGVLSVFAYLIRSDHWSFCNVIEENIKNETFLKILEKLKVLTEDVGTNENN